MERIGRIYGYIRVSTREQNEDRQWIALPRTRHLAAPLVWLAGVCLLLFLAMELGGRI